MASHEDKVQGVLETLNQKLTDHSAALEQGSANATDNKVSYHAAMVAAYSESLHATRLVAVGRDLGEQIKSATETLDRSTSRLAAEIERFTTTADVSSRSLNLWTKVMAIATALLFVVTAVQIFIGLYSLFHPDVPQILFMPK